MPFATFLKLKKDKKNPTFVKATVGGGTDDRYDSRFNLNRFKGDQQLSAIGMANNTNCQGFSLMDVLNFTGETNKMMKGGGGGRIVINNGNGPDFGLPVEGGGASNAGIARTIAGGLNYNDTWNKKSDINGSYFYNDIVVDADQHSVRQNLSPSAYNYVLNSVTNKTTETNRFNLSYDHKIDSFNSLKITPSFTTQQNKNGDVNAYTSTLTDGTLLNRGSSQKSSVSNGEDLKNTVLYKHRFAKKGRTISSNFSMAYNDSRLNGSQSSSTEFSRGQPSNRTDTIDQQNRINSITQAYYGNIVYTEPFSKKTLMEVNGFYGFNKGNLSRHIFDLDHSNGKYDNLNFSQSNNFQNEYQYYGVGVRFRHVEKKYSASFGANYQEASLMSKLKDSVLTIRRQFTTLLPSFNFTYNFSRMKTLKLDYNTSTLAPTTSNLIPIPDSSDRLNIVNGNPSLKQEFIHNAGLQFFSTNPALQKNLMMFGNFSFTQDAIVNSDVVNAQGVRATRPVNVDGVYNAFATIDAGFRLKKLNTRITTGGNVLYSHNVNFIDANKNLISNLSYTPRLSLNYNLKDKFDLSAEGKVSFNDVKYSWTQGLNNHYTQQNYSLEADASLPLDIHFNSDINYIINTGRAVGYNTKLYLWNASLSKLVLKSKKGEIKFSVNDILNQNVGISRNANQNYVEDVTYRSLPRYFMVSFTYSLMKVTSGGPSMIMRRL